MERIINCRTPSAINHPNQPMSWSFHRHPNFIKLTYWGMVHGIGWNIGSTFFDLFDLVFGTPGAPGSELVRSISAVGNPRDGEWQTFGYQNFMGIFSTDTPFGGIWGYFLQIVTFDGKYHSIWGIWGYFLQILHLSDAHWKCDAAKNVTPVGVNTEKHIVGYIPITVSIIFLALKSHQIPLMTQ